MSTIHKYELDITDVPPVEEIYAEVYVDSTKKDGSPRRWAVEVHWGMSHAFNYYRSEKKARKEADKIVDRLRRNDTRGCWFG
jgi:acetyl esterase/lipase